MKDRLKRAKQYLSDHKTSIAFGAGVVAGIVPAAYIFNARYADASWIEIVVDETPEQLLDLMNNTGALRFDSPMKAQTIILASRSVEEALDAVT